MRCGEPLLYHDAARELTCAVCGATELGHISCPNGHYVCDTCHSGDVVSAIERLVHASESGDPFAIAESAMALPELPMLGCDHALIAGGALAAALRNRGVKGMTNSAIQEVFERTRRQARGGYCGLTGVCGITPAVGACVAVLVGAKCGTDAEQRLTMEAATRVSRSITELTGPSCCKAYVRASLETAVEFLSEELDIRLDGTSARNCSFPERHSHGCREELCPYFDRAEAVSTVTRRVAMSDSAGPRAQLDDLLGRAIELGAEKAKVIDASSVAVEQWVSLKCRYGCLFYDRDGYHPPYAPDPQVMRGVLSEYDKAILLSGPKGKALTEVATRLEGEAYDAGYYKAFALTSLSSGGDATGAT